MNNAIETARANLLASNPAAAYLDSVIRFLVETGTPADQVTELQVMERCTMNAAFLRRARPDAQDHIDAALADVVAEAVREAGEIKGFFLID